MLDIPESATVDWKVNDGRVQRPCSCCRKIMTIVFSSNSDKDISKAFLELYKFHGMCEPCWSENKLIDEVERKLLNEYLVNGTMVVLIAPWSTPDGVTVFPVGNIGHVIQDARAGADNYVDICWHGYQGRSFMTPRELFTLMEKRR